MFESRSRRLVSGGLHVALGLLVTCAAELGCSSDLSPASPSPESPSPESPSPGDGGGKRRLAARRIVLDLRELHRQLVVVHGDEAAVLAVDYRYRAAPVALA